MYQDFKECVILLMQHPIMNKPISALSDSECCQAYELIKRLIDFSVNEGYTLLDYIQMARLKFHLGELAYRLNDVRENIVVLYRSVSPFIKKREV